LLEESARLLYQEWFVRLRFPGHEQVPVHDGVPEGWTRGTVGDVVTLQRGFDLPTQEREEGKYPIIAATGQSGTHSEARVKAPGVVTGRSGSLGRVMYIYEDFWALNTTLWVKEFKRASPIYAHHLLQNLGLERFNGGAAVPTLNRNDVHAIEILLPPDALMQKLTATLEPVYALQYILEQKNKKLQQARDLLLPRLMRGELLS
jgi:type I restriction enzyme, S subunit